MNEKKSLPSDMLHFHSSRSFSPEEEELKRILYEKVQPRRKKFIDRLGYENWDPFAPPKDPLDIRTESTQQTAQELLKAFLQSINTKQYSKEYAKGALDAALAVINQEEKFYGIYDFCHWYHAKLLKERGENE